MKSRQRGDVVLAVAATYLLIGFLTVVTNGFKNPENLTKSAQGSEVKVAKNYRGSYE